MPVFTVTGNVDPFLRVVLDQGEAAYCESDAMVAMDATLDLRGKVKGGVVRAFLRKWANGESFFQQQIEAVRGAGTCLLAPTLPGDLTILECGQARYTLNDGAFVAAASGVAIRVRTQSIGNALFARSGGLFVMEATGSGQVVVSGFGAMTAMQVEPGRDVIVDHSHVVAWDSALRYHVSVTTGKGSLLGNLINSRTSGEGIVLRFSGQGNVYVCSRNREAFKKWCQPKKST